MLFNELADLFFQLFLFAAQAAVGLLVVTEVLFDEVEVTPWARSQALQDQGEDDLFIILLRVDPGTVDVFELFAEGGNGLGPRFFLCLREVRDERRFRHVCAARKLVQDDGAHAVEALEHPRRERFVRRQAEHFLQFFRRKGKGIHAHEVGRKFVWYVGGNGPHGSLALGRLDEGFDDHAVFSKDDVAVLAHELDVDFARRQASRYV